jgi:hypothetical protein
LDSARSKIFFFFVITQTGPRGPPIQLVPEANSPGVKQSRLESDQSPPSGTVLKNLQLICLHSVRGENSTLCGDVSNRLGT